MEPLVSVIIPTYNRAYCIEQAVESVLNQNYEHMEVLVVDDGSTDATEKVIQGIADKRVVYWKNPGNGGAAAARNIGIQMAKGEYIAFQDSDDLWLGEKLKKQIDLLLQEDFGMVYSCCERRFLDGRMEMIPRKGIQWEAKQGEIYPYLLSESYIAAPTVVVKREIIQQIQGFDEAMENYEDYDFVIRVAKHCKIGFINEVLVSSRILEDGIDMNLVKGIISSAYLVRKHQDDLKYYGLYEKKRSIVCEAASACGILKPVLKFMKSELL